MFGLASLFGYLTPMSKLWLPIVKPRQAYAKWLIFLTLLTLVVAGSLGYFEQVRDALDTEQFTFNVGNYGIRYMTF